MDKLSFKYVPLTFITSQLEIQRQIRNTIVFNYLLRKYDDLRVFSQVIDTTQYGLNASASSNGSHKFLRISDIKEGNVDWANVPYCNCKDEEAYKLYKGDILIARTGGTTGKSYLISDVPDNAVFAGYLIRLRAKDEFDPVFIYEFVNSYAYWPQILEMKMGSAQPNVNAEKLKQLRIPFAPPDIQRELVKLFNGKECSLTELNSLIEKGKRGHSNSFKLHEEFNLQKELVSDLRQVIFREAIQGKLTHSWRKSNVMTESALILLERIKKEKEKLINEGKIRREGPSPPIKVEEIPFELPEGWVWCRFREPTINRDGERVPVSSEERELRKGNFDYYGASGIIDSIDAYLFDKDLLLIGEDGANLINRTTPIAFMAKGRYWVNNHAHVIDAISNDVLLYLEIYINAIDLEPYVTGTAQPKMNQAKMNSIVVAFPSLEEQKEIVSKVNQLMHLCDELDSNISISQKDSESLVDAVLNDVIEEQHMIPTGA